MTSIDEQAKAALAAAGQTDTGRDSRYHVPAYRFAKRTMDIVLASVLLVLRLPLFLFVALLIAVTDGTPVTFRQKRVGQNGRLFYLYKFRSRVHNADEILRSRPELMEEYKKQYKIKDDPRISPLGNFLRSSTLDELPQLLNVLKGEMSLVGPRPIVEPELEKFGDAKDVYLAMKPGCAGLWQCSGRSDTTYEERVAFDILILWRTFVAVLLRRGAM